MEFLRYAGKHNNLFSGDLATMDWTCQGSSPSLFNINSQLHICLNLLNILETSISAKLYFILIYSFVKRTHLLKVSSALHLANQVIYRDQCGFLRRKIGNPSWSTTYWCVQCRKPSIVMINFAWGCEPDEIKPLQPIGAGMVKSGASLNTWCSKM